MSKSYKQVHKQWNLPYYVSYNIMIKGIMCMYEGATASSAMSLIVLSIYTIAAGMYQNVQVLQVPVARCKI